MITSKQNKTVKLARSLFDKKNRDELGLYLVSGIKLVKEALNSSHEVVSVLTTEKLCDEFSALFSATETVSFEVMDYISDEVTPQGVVAIVKKPNSSLIETDKTCILLDGVSDPGNVGAIIRTMAGAGYNSVYATTDSADAFSPKAVRASMSGVFKVDIYTIKREDVSEFIKTPIVIADMNGENVFETKNLGEFCLVIGNEARGISKPVRDMAKRVVAIPMQNGMESLNASVSAGILMYQLKLKN